MILKKFSDSSLPAFLMTLFLFFIGAVSIEGFTSLFSIRAMLVLTALLVIPSCGQTFAMLLGGIDLSIPFMIGFSNVMIAQLSSLGMDFGPAIFIVLFLGVFIGGVNGLLSSYFKVHPLIITLGIGTCILGIVQLWTKGYPTGNAPEYISNLVSIGISPFPLIVPLATLAVFTLHFFNQNTKLGKQIYALGNNENAARYILVKPVFIWAFCFAFSGFLASITGILLLGFSGSAFAQVGEPYLFQTVAAAVIGGIALSGGKGTVLGTLAGSFALIEINTLLIGYALEPSIVQVFLGVVIILVVMVYGRNSHLRMDI